MKRRYPNPEPALIIYQRLARTCVRRRPTPSHHSASPAQQLQRQKFALAMATAQPLVAQLDDRWHRYARRHHKTALNLLVGHILRHAITLDPDTGQPTVDTSRIDLTAPGR